MYIGTCLDLLPRAVGIPLDPWLNQCLRIAFDSSCDHHRAHQSQIPEMKEQNEWVVFIKLLKNYKFILNPFLSPVMDSLHF